MTVSSAIDARPLALRLRPDLRIQEIPFRRRTYWSVCDPISLRYYQLREEEFFVLQQLDNRASLATIRERFNQRFAPRHVDVRQLNALLVMLHREGLVIADEPEQDRRLGERHTKRLRREWLGRWTNVLAIRFRGFHPQPLLDGLYPYLRFLFTWTSVAFGVAFILAAATLLLAELPTVVARLPSARDFFDTRNILWLAVALAVAKVLHEFGHALTCRHFGGRCRELGVMLLVFTPCLYCDTTDAWMIPDRRERIAISAAGMFVELLLAAACTFLWWFSEPGFFNSLCLNLILVCSIATVVFNANPLLPYDGYFILSDWLDVPNLSEQAGDAWRRWLLTWGAGLDAAPLPLPDVHPAWLRAYAVASLGYRWFVVAAILWFIHAAAKVHGVEFLAQVLTLLVVGGMIAMPVWRLARFLRDPMRRRAVRWGRALSIVAVAGAVGGGLLLIPLPHRVTAPAVLEPAGAVHVYVAVPGTLTTTLAAGTRVKKDDIVARLVNLELEQEIEAIRTQLAVQKMHVANLTGQQVRDRIGDELGAAGQLPTARRAVADLQQRLAARRDELQRLTVLAPVAGVVLPPRVKPAQVREGELADWSGTPLDERNRGCFLEAGVELCQIGDPRQLEATLVVDQGQVLFVEPGQPLSLQIEESSNVLLTGRVTEIARLNADAAPPELLARRLLALRQPNDRQPGSAAPELAESSYRVRAQLDAPAHAVPLRASGRARIRATARPLARRAFDWLCRTFRVEL